MPSVSLSPIFNGWQGFTVGGLPLSGGKLYSYLAGTSTPHNTYTTIVGNVANSNPIILQSDGRPQFEIWLEDGIAYKFVLTDSLGLNTLTYDNISSPQTDIFIDLAAPSGSSLIGFIQAGTGAVAETAQKKMRETVSPEDYGAVGDGMTNDSGAIQSGINYLNSIGGGTLQLGNGKTYLVSTPIQTYNQVTIRGHGDSSQILVSTDIEVFNSSMATANDFVFRPEFHDFFINKTVTGATTKYDIHLQNPLFARFVNVHIKSGHIDSSYSSTNVGGIFLDKPVGSTVTAFCCSIVDCWIQNNSIYLKGITDSVISGGYVWGHVRQFAIRIAGGGNIAIENVNGIISSQYNGGIWIDGASISQIRIEGNEHDGNPLLTLGSFVYCPQSALSVIVKGNTIWGCGKHGLDITDPVGWTVSGNQFWKGNVQDNFYDDVRITAVSFQPNGNVVAGNSFLIDASRTNKGYAIREVNGGNFPVQNTYSSNGVAGGNYVSPAILVLNNATMIGNVGAGTDSISQILGHALQIGGDNGSPGGLIANTSADVAAAGTLDLTINTASFGGQPGGFSGILTVTAVRNNASTQSRRVVYAANGYGTTAVFTSLALQDGSGGGLAFTLTMTSNGVIRFTDTSGSGSTIGVRMAFYGSKSLA